MLIKTLDGIKLEKDWDPSLIGTARDKPPVEFGEGADFVQQLLLRDSLRKNEQRIKTHGDNARPALTD